MDSNHSEPFDKVLEFLGTAEAPSAIRELIRPGRDATDLLMRTAWRDEREANLAAVLLFKGEVFDIQAYRDLVRLVAASRVSVQGRSRNDVVQVATGVAVPGWGLQREETRRTGILSRMFGGGKEK